MIPLLIASIALQVAFVVHAVKTGRPVMWIFIIMLLPAVGAIAYLLLEVLPGMRHGRTGPAIAANPDARMRSKPKWRLYWPTRLNALSRPVPERRKLAGKCLDKGYHEEARDLLESCLIYGASADLLANLAVARFRLHDHAGTIKALDRLRAEFPAAEGDAERRLRARSTEALTGV